MAKKPVDNMEKGKKENFRLRLSVIYHKRHLDFTQWRGIAYSEPFLFSPFFDKSSHFYGVYRRNSDKKRKSGEPSMGENEGIVV
jgi:hypothetical protein